MKTSFQLLLVHFGICCVCSTSVTVESNPQTNGGFIQTEPDRTITLTCTTNDSTDTQELLWYRNEQLVSLKDGNRQDVSHLCIEPVSREDNGVIFTCKLKANDGVNASIQLEVNYAPDLNGTEEVQVEEKSNTVLSCKVQAHPAVRVVWKKDDELLDLSSGVYQTSNNGVTATLSIFNIIRNVHQGVFSCETTSTMYGVRSKNFTVTVGDQVMKFPLWPAVTGVLVILATILLAVVSRWKRIVKCFKKE